MFQGPWARHTRPPPTGLAETRYVVTVFLLGLGQETTVSHLLDDGKSILVMEQIVLEFSLLDQDHHQTDDLVALV